MINREFFRLIIAWESRGLKRTGYWACHNCSAHNYTTNVVCSVCGVKHWRLIVPTELISCGPPTGLVQNQVYALPASRCLLFCATAATLEQSNEVAFASPKALTLDANGQAEVAGGFLRSTAGAAIITLKKA